MSTLLHVLSFLIIYQQTASTIVLLSSYQEYLQDTPGLIFLLACHFPSLARLLWRINR